jgi:hypothetical protein
VAGGAADVAPAVVLLHGLTPRVTAGLAARRHAGRLSPFPYRRLVVSAPRDERETAIIFVPRVANVSAASNRSASPRTANQ